MNLDYLTFFEFGLESFGQRFIITLIRYFTGLGLENTWTMNLDYNYILQDLDLKIFRLQILSLIVIYLTRFGLEKTCATNLDYYYYILLDLDLEILGL